MAKRASFLCPPQPSSINCQPSGRFCHAKRRKVGLGSCRPKNQGRQGQGQEQALYPPAHRFVVWLRPGYRDIDFLTSGTLEELHEDTFELFDRYDAHAWKFSFDTDDPYSREGRHYVPRFILGYARRGVCCRGDYPGQPESQERCNLRLSL